MRQVIFSGNLINLPPVSSSIPSTIKLISCAQDINLIVDGIDEETGGRFIKFPENITCLNSMNELLDKYGEIPLPPYIKNSEEESFHENSYQTEYATNPGAPGLVAYSV